MKRRQGHLAITVPIVAIAIAGCATTRINSQMAPQFQRAYGTIMVAVDFQNLGARQDAEQQFLTALRSRGTHAVRSVDLFFPGRTYTSDERAQILQDAGVEAVLVAAPAGSGTSASWIPATTTTQGTATVIGNTVVGSSTRTTTGGYAVNKPWAQYEARVVDVVSGQTVWMASMNSSGNAFADWGDLARSMAQTTSARLWQDGIVWVPSQDAFEESVTAAQVATEPSSPRLTNDDVVQMVVAGIGDDVVIQKIRTSEAQFRLDVDALVQLKGAGVSDTVLSVMLEYPPASEPRQDVTAQTTITSPPPTRTDRRGTNLAGSVPSARARLRVIHDHRNSAFQSGCDGEVFLSANGFRFVSGQSNHSFTLSWKQVGRMNAKPDWGQAAFSIQHRLRVARDRTFNFKIIVAEGTGEAELEELLDVADRFQ